MTDTKLDTQQMTALLEQAIATSRNEGFLDKAQVPLSALDHEDGFVIAWGEDIGQVPMRYTLTTFDGETREASVHDYLKGWVRDADSIPSRFADWASAQR